MPAQEMAADSAGAHQKTIGADKNYDTKGFVAEMRRLGVTPHVAQNNARSGGSAMPAAASRRYLARSRRSAGCAS